jgi:hypothetical protein
MADQPTTDQARRSSVNSARLKRWRAGKAHIRIWLDDTVVERVRAACEAQGRTFRTFVEGTLREKCDIVEAFAPPPRKQGRAGR